MESQIELLLKKYWQGTSTPEEERIIKDYFLQNPSLAPEGSYFRYLQAKSKVKMQHQTPSIAFKPWRSVAASVAVGILTAFFIIQNAKKDPFAIEDPKKALEATRNALMMIGEGLNEGQQHTLQLTKFNKAQDELQETKN